jgi:hypothetical protein
MFGLLDQFRRDFFLDLMTQLELRSAGLAVDRDYRCGCFAQLIPFQYSLLVTH